MPTRNSHHKIQVFRTVPLENLSAAVKLDIKKRFLGNPTLGKDLVRENIVMGTGCSVLEYVIWHAANKILIINTTNNNTPHTHHTHNKHNKHTSTHKHTHTHTHNNSII